MCGIVGLLTPKPLHTELLRSNDLLGHRGPDDGHFYVDAGIGLAARRLSIIDLVGGRQPLSNEDGSIWITYNGEVFNAPELRAELKARGHQFRTETDTETVVHAYEEWGETAVSKLRGMFAVGLWDAKREQLLLARDRFGMKPLYYARVGNRFGFASEIRPLFTLLPQLPRRANHEALWQLFELGYIPTPQTAVCDVFSLPAAHYLVLANGRSPQIKSYWQLDQPIDYPKLDEEEATEQFMAHLREAVDAWRLSDVPVGSLLSGGIDSSAMAALLTEISGEQVHTFHVAFTASSHNEAEKARLVAEAIGSQHHEFTFSTVDFDYLPKVIDHLESPQCSASSIPIYLLYKACREAGFKVIMTGEGADELLGGYHWFDGDRRIRPLLYIPRPLRQLAAQLPLNISPDGRRVLAHGNGQTISRYHLWQRVSTAAQRQRLFQKNGSHRSTAALWEEKYEERVNGRSPLDQFIYLETQTRMVDFINFEVDRMSMAASIEARPPFLDHKLWEFCATLPPSFKLTSQMNKRLLRRGMKGLLPDVARQQPKQGLAAPHSQWWRENALPAWAEDCIHPAALAETGYFDPTEVANLRDEHVVGKRDNGRLLTGILTTQLWHQSLDIRND